MLELQYIHYLQSLLRKHQIAFEDECSYIANRTLKEPSGNNQQQRPLQTNLRPPLIASTIHRYSRQMLLKEIAYDGQITLLKSKIAIVGSGGIGCPLAMYLAAAGVGTLGLFDNDVVQISNLHRQIGHRTSTVGHKKTSSLKSTVHNLNPTIEVNQHPGITASNVCALEDYDIVIDGSDNPKCRYIVNDYCMFRHKKLLSGACIGWEAQITCYGGGAACYRCLWGDQQVSFGGCSALGVIGMLPGLVGLILALQALKLILKGETDLSGYLLTFSGKKCEFKKLKLRAPKKECLACGDHPLNINQYDYDSMTSCKQTSPLPEVPSLSWEQFLVKSPRPCILDVRPSNLYNIVHLVQSKSLPYEQLIATDKALLAQCLGDPGSKPIAVSCAKGIMSRRAANYLRTIGYDAYSLEGGIEGYAKGYDSSIPPL